MTVPRPTPIYRFLHIDNLDVCLRRGGLHAPNQTPEDDHVYRTIHNPDVQAQRRMNRIPCGPDGSIHDYVSFYFGPRSPMLLQLHTGRVEGYRDGQEQLVYVVSTAQAIEDAPLPFVFSDGHGIAAFTRWFDDLTELIQVDWEAVAARYWADTVEDMDRQRRKQAEFLVYRECPWNLITEIGVLNAGAQSRVENILQGFDPVMRRPVRVQPGWYY
jgi:hypothetical protein